MDGPKHRDAEMQTAAEMLERLGRRATTREVAELLGLSVRRVQQLCRRGWLGRRVGTQWLIGEELRQFMRYERPPGRPTKTCPAPISEQGFRLVTPEEWRQLHKADRSQEQLHSPRTVRDRITGG